MCNLYSLTKGQAAIVALVRAMRDTPATFRPMPGNFPDYPAPIVRNAPDGVRELAMARWGIHQPTGFWRRSVTNIPEREEPALAALAQTGDPLRRALASRANTPTPKREKHRRGSRSVMNATTRYSTAGAGR